MSRGIIAAIIGATLIVAFILTWRSFQDYADQEMSVDQVEQTEIIEGGTDAGEPPSGEANATAQNTSEIFATAPIEGLPEGYDLSVFEGQSVSAITAMVEQQIAAGLLPETALDEILRYLVQN